MKKSSALLLGLLLSCLPLFANDGCEMLCIGTYGGHIYRYNFNLRNGAFTAYDTISTPDASFITLGGMGNLFWVNETDGAPGISCGSSGENKVLRRLDNIGESPCHVYYDWNRDLVLTAEYGGGSLSVFSLDEDYCLKERIQHIEYGPGSHIHQICALDDEYTLASDVGKDKIRVLRFEGNTLVETGLDLDCGRGSGPRHLALDKKNHCVYCICELSDEVIRIELGRDLEPSLEITQRICGAAVKAGGSADIHIHPDGKHLYASHRLQGDGISVYKIEGGKLIPAGFVKTGKHPRNFHITRDGRYLLVACRDSKCVEVYKINKRTGIPSFVSKLSFDKDKPVCIIPF